MKINSIEELEELLNNEQVTPNQANKILIKSLGLLDVSFGEEKLSKESVLKEIEVLKVCLNHNEIPLFSLAQIQDSQIKEFNIKQIYKKIENQKEYFRDLKEEREYLKSQIEYFKISNDKILEQHERLIEIIGQRNRIEAVEKSVIPREI
jgi:hypothetical protein